MEYLIKAIIKITNQIYYQDSFINSQEIYLWGGCYELIKIIQEFYPDIIIWIDNVDRHCAFEFEGQLYDANGLIEKNRSLYRKADEKDIKWMENLFGKQVKGMQLFENVTKKMYERGSSKEEIINTLTREEIEEEFKIKR